MIMCPDEGLITPYMYFIQSSAAQHLRYLTASFVGEVDLDG